MPPPFPVDTAACACSHPDRVAALRRYGILDTPPEPVFDDIARLACGVFAVPMAAINFVTADRQWLKSRVGLGDQEFPLDPGICPHAMVEGDLLVIPDVAEDARFAGGPLVRGPLGIRFYAGAVLRTPEGHPIGTLCVLDRAPRALSAAEADHLRILAGQIMTHLELRRSEAEARAAEAQAKVSEAAAKAAESRAGAALAKARDGEARFRTVFEQATIGMVTFQADGTIVDINDALCRILARPRADLVGSHSSRITHPDDRAPTADAVRRLVSGSDPTVMFDKRYLRPDGQVVYARVGISALRVDGGEPTGFIGLVEDVTERRQSEQRRQEDSARLERQARILDTVLSFTPDFAYIFDREARFLYANRELLRVWAKTLDEIVGKTCLELGYPAWHAEMHAREIAQVIATRRPIRGEVPFTGGSGISGIYDYIFTPVFGPDGEVEVIAGTTRDVTAHRAAARERERLIELHRLALDCANMGWWSMDPSTGRMDCDERFRRIFGLGGGPVTFEATAAMIHADDVAGVRSAVEAALGGGGERPFVVEYRLRRPDGAVRWISTKGRVYRAETSTSGGSDVPVSFVGTVADVTDERQLIESNRLLLDSERAARSDAERASRTKDEFLATLSHELRTPLNAILGWTQILRSEHLAGQRADRADATPAGRAHVSADDLGEGLATIERNARAQVQIIEDLLDMSRIISGKVRLDVRRLDLSGVVGAAIETIRPSANAKGIRLSATMDPLESAISGDANRLQQVFWNVLSNAVKFTPRDGQIRVALRRVESQLEVSVTDTGEGIAAEFLPYVFGRFRQADASTTRRHGGLGLGLAIVKELVELHGGTIAIHSDGVGKGTTVRVRLPLSAAREAHGPSQPRGNAGPGAEGGPMARAELDGVTVLVVDDEPDARSLLRRVLQSCDAHVLCAASATEALDALLRHRPSILLADIGMPGEDGLSLISRVRALPAEKGGQIPAVALTAYARPEDRLRSLRAGFQKHMVKPVETSELIAVVADLTRSHPRG
jgi:PAS domain S-box-containing protein